MAQLPDLNDRIITWCRRGNAQLVEHDATRYEMIWHEASGTAHFIEVYPAPNGFAARMGVLDERGTVRLVSDHSPLTSWNCAPYRQLEEVLDMLRKTPPRVELPTFAYGK